MKKQKRKSPRYYSYRRDPYEPIVRGATTIATIGVLGAMTTGVIGAINK